MLVVQYTSPERLGYLYSWVAPLGLPFPSMPSC